MRRTAHPCAVPASGRLRGRGFLRYIRFLTGGALFWCGFRYAGRKGYTVGILQQMEHTSLDEIREAVEAGLAGARLRAAIRWRSFIKTHREIPQPSAPSRSSLPHRALCDRAHCYGCGPGRGCGAAGWMPIVFSAVADPVAAGLVDAFDRTTAISRVFPTALMSQKYSLWRTS